MCVCPLSLRVYVCKMCVAVHAYKLWELSLLFLYTRQKHCCERFALKIENGFLVPEPDAYKFQITKFSLQHWNTPLIEVICIYTIYNICTINGWLTENPSDSVNERKRDSKKNMNVDMDNVDGQMPIFRRMLQMRSPTI